MTLSYLSTLLLPFDNLKIFFFEMSIQILDQFLIKLFTAYFYYFPIDLFWFHSSDDFLEICI